MTEYIVKQEDSLPVFEETLEENLSTANEARLYVEHAASGTLVVNDVMTIDNAADGSVSYNFDADQTARDGFHNAEIVVDIGGEDRSFPKKGYYTFEFTDPLNRDGNIDPAEAGGTFDASKLTMRGDIVDDNGNLVYDYSLTHVPQTILENDSITVTAGTNLSGGGSVALGGSTTLSVDLWRTTTVTSNYTASMYENVLADAGGGAVTVTLPSPTTDLEVVVKKIDSSTNVVEVATPSSETIDGQSSLTITSQYTARTITSDGTNYYII